MREHHVAAQRQIGAVELQHEAGVDDGAILARHHVGERVTDKPRRSGSAGSSGSARSVRATATSRSALPPWRRPSRRFARAMSASTAGKSFQATGPEQAGRCWNGEANVGEHRREFGELGLAGAERRRARAVEAGEAILDVDGVIGAALLAVVDHVEPAGDLPSAPRRRPRCGPPARARRFWRRGASAPPAAIPPRVAGRGRLPVWVVRIRCVLRFMAFPRFPRFCRALSARLGPISQVSRPYLRRTPNMWGVGQPFFNGSAAMDGHCRGRARAQPRGRGRDVRAQQRSAACRRRHPLLRRARGAVSRARASRHRRLFLRARRDAFPRDLSRQHLLRRAAVRHRHLARLDACCSPAS